MAKSFKDNLNPAMRFISTPAEDQPTAPIKADRAEIPEGYKLNPLYIETKSKRLQLLVQPSLYEKVKAMAADQGTSVNELIHSILEDATKGQG